MHVHHMSNTGPSSRTQQQTAGAKSPTFSLSPATGLSGPSAGSAAAAPTTSLTSSVTALTSPTSTSSAAPTNTASPFASMASNLQSILLGASQAGPAATSLPSQAAGAYGLAGSLLGA